MGFVYIVQKSKAELWDKIRELAKMSFILPNEIKPDEKELWEWYCKGGISALRWVLDLDDLGLYAPPLTSYLEDDKK